MMLSRLRQPCTAGVNCLHHSALLYAKPDPPRGSPVASTSTSKPQDWRTTRHRLQKKKERDGTRRKPLHDAPLSSSPASIDPLRVLDQIRSASPLPSASPESLSTPTPGNGSTIDAHNRAVSNLHAVLTATPDATHYEQAFVHGWLPIRANRQAGRLVPETVAKVLEVAGEALLRAEDSVEWEPVRELAVFLAGETGMPGLAAFCWRQLANVDGARRVVQLLDDLGNDINSLRASSHAPDALSRRQADLSTTPKQHTLPADVLSAYVAAHALLHHFKPSASSSARTVFPALFAPPSDLRFPRLRHLQHSEALLQRYRVTLPPTSQRVVSAWLRQAELAQTWIFLPNGLAVVKNAAVLFRRGDYKQAKELWEAVQDAVDGDAAWLSTEQWQESASWRWVNGRAGLDEEEVPHGGAGDNRNAGETVEEAVTSPQTNSSTSLEASFRQAHVATFLRLFTRAERYPEASAIWSWLAARSPPLPPGIVAWTALLNGYAGRGDVAPLEAAWDQMTSIGVVPDIWAWSELATVHFDAKDVDGGMQIVETMLTAPELAQDWKDERVALLIYNRFVAAMLRGGGVDQAKALLERIDERGAKIGTSTINLFLRHYARPARPDLTGIIESLKLIGVRELEPDVVSFTTVLQSLLKSGTKDATARLMKIMEVTGVKPSVVTYGAIIHQLAGTGTSENLTAALHLLDELERRRLATNEIIYTSIIQGFLRGMALSPSHNSDAVHPFFAAALRLKDRMAERKIPLNRVGYNGIIQAAMSLQTSWGVQLALKTFREVQAATKARSRDVDTDGVVKQADTWYVLISGFAKMGDWSTARELLRELEATGFEVRSRQLSRLVNDVRRGGRR